ncbi:MAG: NAD(P)/FAD-dependent oxidoreductase [Solirubrobacterales bacterium]|nr:NAD(P)/FAD-dependent oxidoreductase [Solirubrobacterales bacterium]
MDTDFECVVVGGGAAGLSAALVLGRARRKTLVIDAGQQSNRPDKGIGGLTGNNGTPPAEFYERAGAEVDQHPTVERIDDSVATGRREGGFVLTTGTGDEVRAANVILATGMKYEYPDLPGLPELWGHDAFHCPFCHGWEARDGHIAVITQSTADLMRTRLIQLWTDRVTVLTDGSEIEDAEQAAGLEAARIPVVEKEVERLVVVDGSLEAIRFTDGSELEADSVMVPITMRQRSDLAAQLGAEELGTANPMIIDALKVDYLQHTSIPGLSAAGDIATLGAPSVAAAIAEGHRAGAGVVHDIAFS